MTMIGTVQQEQTQERFTGACHDTSIGAVAVCRHAGHANLSETAARVGYITALGTIIISGTVAILCFA